VIQQLIKGYDMGK